MLTQFAVFMPNHKEYCGIWDRIKGYLYSACPTQMDVMENILVKYSSQRKFVEIYLQYNIWWAMSSVCQSMKLFQLSWFCFPHVNKWLVIFIFIFIFIFMTTNDVFIIQPVITAQLPNTQQNTFISISRLIRENINWFWSRLFYFFSVLSFSTQCSSPTSGIPWNLILMGPYILIQLEGKCQNK